MLLYYPFWLFMGFTLHFYIIFWTNLLTGGLVKIDVFCLFQCFAQKEYQTESKRNETFGRVIFGTNVIQRTWSGRQETYEEATRQGARLPPGRALLPRGRLVVSLTSTPSLLVCFRSKKDHRKGFILFWTPFGIPFLQNSKIGKKTETGTGPPVNRLVPKII